MLRIRIFLISLWFILLGWGIYYSILPHTPPQHFLVIPHFTIAPSKLDRVWSDLRDKVTSTSPTIIIISPDHFESYKTNNLIYDPEITTLCIQWYCQESQGAFVPHNYSSQSWMPSSLVLKDHGIGAHLPFVKRFFPDSKVIPLLIQPRSEQYLDELIATIKDLSMRQETIVIGSVDRSHYVPEPRDYLHDSRSWSIFSSRENSWKDWKSLDVDCPSCLWVVDHLAESHHQVPELLWRDSSAQIFRSTGTDNTSRLAVWYVSSNDKVNMSKQYPLMTWVTLLMAGDLFYDRWVLQSLPNPQTLSSHFRSWYENHDTKINPFFSFHRLWASIDLVGFNLETPLFQSGTICYPSQKPYSFCSSESIFDVLQPLWFNFVSLANNHRYDAGNSQYDSTKDILSWRTIGIVSDDQFLQTIIRGIKISLQWYDFTTPERATILDQACQDIKKSKSEGYRVIVSSHWWKEYEKIHNVQQKSIAQQLISCWADAIVGHHPHVIQDIEWIDEVPVVYSLGNFLMDQGFRPETSVGMLLGMIIPLSWTIQIMTGTIDTTP